MKDKKALFLKIEQALDTIRPFLKEDGGDVKLLGVSDNMVAKIKLLGACETCNMSEMTMKAGIEEAIKKTVPQIQSIIAVG